uniref:DUF4817 domain-containing protein n=1 Tax=Heterorhabditis bacteriophora TaxID=37862 RepID=A0A1I7WS89_HETBA
MIPSSNRSSNKGHDLNVVTPYSIKHSSDEFLNLSTYSAVINEVVSRYHSSAITTEPVKVIRQNTIAMFNFEVEDDQWTSAHSSPKLDKTINVGDITSTLWRIKATVKIVIRKKDTNTTVERIFTDHTFTYVTKSIDESIPWAEVDDILMCNSSESPKFVEEVLSGIYYTLLFVKIFEL